MKNMPLDELERLLIERQCLRLMTNYCLYLDDRNTEAFLDLFVDDAVWIQMNEPPYELSGREAVRRFVEARSTRKINRHLMLNPQVTVLSANQATAFSIGLVIDGPRQGDTLPVPLNGIELLVEYRDTFRLDPKGWRIVRREMTRIIDKKAPVAAG